MQNLFHISPYKMYVHLSLLQKNNIFEEYNALFYDCRQRDIVLEEEVVSYVWNLLANNRNSYRSLMNLLLKKIKYLYMCFEDYFDKIFVFEIICVGIIFSILDDMLLEFNFFLKRNYFKF